MINVRELRIGNYVLAHNRNYDGMEIKRVFNIQNHTASLEGQGICIVDDRLTRIAIDNTANYVFPSNPCVEHCMEPIPIRIDVLLRCGFICTEGSMTYERDRFKVSEIDNKIFVFVGSDISGEYRWSDIGIEVKTLHQLQNLYYDVIGEDLIVNLEIDADEN